ncbi:MAG: pyrroline-5-carboxylate reductase dimerization domain-containing protein [Coxiellaceae bacterium]|nr:pyrroline-5-carboxylate reductase dimerization domain-containing protein [Coxiellaceae bacterium]
MKVGVLGGTGWIGSHIVNYLIESKTIAAQDVYVSNHSGDFSTFKHKDAVNCTTDNQAIADTCDVVFLSVPPRCVDQLQMQVKHALVISVMAGVQMASLQQVTQADRIVRSMPNAAVEVGESMTPWFVTDAVNQQDKQTAQHLLETFGHAIEIQNEDQLNFLTALSGSSHGTIAYFQAAMIQAATNFGLPAGQAKEIVQQVFTGNSLLMQRGKRDAQADVDLVIEYAGTTAALCTRMNELEVDKRIEQSILASYQKASSNMNSSG